ncbi:DUF4158 domain-containing protein [Sphaerisporangium perillae]|uniref:DUF4158 domain-containing protein n=1 Tax=Sphaerisporangium perillae TaxID=2935860 RepID=UPI00200E1FC9|nr:DUF4158 domain-containing protein [Sphaerisporangium perillae]
MSDDEAAAYGRYLGEPTRVKPEKIFFLDDADRKLIARRHGDHHRLGFALQLTTARFLGRFLPDPLQVPVEVVEYLASQPGMADVSQIKQYEFGANAVLDALPNPNTVRAYTAGVGKTTIRRGEDRPWAAVADDEIGEALEALWGGAAVNTWNARRAAVASSLAWCRKRGQAAPAARSSSPTAGPAPARSSAPATCAPAPAWAAWPTARPAPCWTSTPH